MHCLAANSKLSQNSWYAFLMFVVLRGGNLSTNSPVRMQKRFQLALQKLQHFSGSLWAKTSSLSGVMREGQCCDHGSFPGTCLSGSRLSWPKLTKASSGVVPTFHQREKLAASFASYSSPWLLDVAQESRLSPSGDVVLLPSWYAGSWSHQHTDWGVGTSGWLKVWVASGQVCKR